RYRGIDVALYLVEIRRLGVDAQGRLLFADRQFSREEAEADLVQAALTVLRRAETCQRRADRRLVFAAEAQTVLERQCRDSDGGDRGGGGTNRSGQRGFVSRR